MAVVRAGKLLVQPVTGFAAWYTRTAKARPFMTGLITSGVKTSVADMFAQKVRKCHPHRALQLEYLVHSTPLACF